jgi:hypothetical protein
MSRHYTEDDLTLYFYGEGRGRADIESHLESCAQCATLYRDVAGTLTLVTTPEAPARDDRYGLEVWQRIRHQLPQRQRFVWFRGFIGFKGFNPFNRFAGFAAAAVVLVIAAFIAGQRFSPNPMNPMNQLNPMNSMNQVDPAAAKRILLTSVADHLDRSERVLTDLMNAADPHDISVEQAWAEDLLDASRLYRQDAVAAGEPSVATVLDELERNLLEIVHSPSRISNDDLEQIRRRIDAAALLFKVRVLGDELRRRDKTS